LHVAPARPSPRLPPLDGVPTASAAPATPAPGTTHVLRGARTPGTTHVLRGARAPGTIHVPLATRASRPPRASRSPRTPGAPGGVRLLRGTRALWVPGDPPARGAPGATPASGLVAPAGSR